MASKVEVDGADELRRSMANAADDLGDLDQAQTATTTIVTNAAKARAPKVSGHLVGSIIGRKSGDEVVVSATAVYAGVIHWGWPARNIAANPFLSNAATQTESTWIKAYESQVEKTVDKIKGA